MHRFKCPHCGGSIEVLKKDLNCKIFRHGIYKETMQPLAPHSSKDICDEARMSGKIYGCGKPFKICILSDSAAIIVTCKYI